MSTITNGNWLCTLAGELCLLAAAIMWLDLILRGISPLGVVLPVAFTLAGGYWLEKVLSGAGRRCRATVRSRVGRIA